ncbi:MAG: PQ-loop domain-containing transporter [Patescibacteria group bacterium]|nr:PQ-loop domain-containing transporter [Patescibacteria group bacterium]
MNTHHLHHVSIRKRVSKKFEEYPSKIRSVRWLDNFLIVVAIVAPMTMIPQIVKVFATHDATGLSMLSWALFCFFNVFWIFYGVVHRSLPIIISNSLWFVTQLIIVMGILIYG